MTSDGMLYRVDDTKPLSTRSAACALTALRPVISCPNCGLQVIGLAGATEAFPMPARDLPTVFHYQLDPCGCRVNQDWAAAFSVELNRRKFGETPGHVVDMTEQERATRAARLQQQISALYDKLDALRDDVDLSAVQWHDAKEYLEYQLVALTDWLMRLVPGKHNFREDVAVSQAVKEWAEKNKLATPAPVKAPRNSRSSPYGYAGFDYLPSYPMPKAYSPLKPGIAVPSLEAKPSDSGVAGSPVHVELNSVTAPLNWNIGEVGSAGLKNAADAVTVQGLKVSPAVVESKDEPVLLSQGASVAQYLRHAHESHQCQLAMMALRNYEAFCLQIILTQVQSGCTLVEARQFLNMAWSGLTSWIEHKRPLHDKVALFVAAVSAAASSGSQPFTAPAVAPRPAAAVPVAPAPVAADPVPLAVPSGTVRPRRLIRLLLPKK